MMNIWVDVVREAEKDCSLQLELDLETYLSSLLHRYVNRPDVVRKVFATAFLQALQLESHQRSYSLQQIGDECLLLTGLFPRLAAKRCVKIRYFVNLGQAAYAAVSSSTSSSLYNLLSVQFVPLMDVLQAIRSDHHLLPLEAYEQWQELGSQRAFTILQSYTAGTPFK